MPPAPDEARPQTSRKRPWYRLHLVTWLALLFMAGALTLIVVPGEVVDTCQHPISTAREAEVRQGWPWAYMTRSAPITSSDFCVVTRYVPPWRIPEAWGFGGDVERFSLDVLAYDVLSVAALLVVTCAAVEAWRRRRRHAWQFSLREVLALFIVVAGVMGYWAWCRQRPYAEEPAVASLRDGGYFCTYDYQGPAWLKKLVGDYHLTDFYAVTYVSLGPGKDPGPCPACLDQLSCLEEVDFGSGARVCDEHLEPLGQQPRIRYVNASCQRITDAGLKHLIPLTKLRVLRLAETRITDEGLQTLGQFRSLQELDLAGTQITSAGLRWLRAMTNLEELDLCDTRVDDDGLQYLAGMTHLRRLDLRGTSTGDAGLIRLKCLKKLRTIHLGCDMTDEGTARLRESLPQCNVYGP